MKWYPKIESIKRYDSETGVPTNILRCRVMSRLDGSLFDEIANIYAFNDADKVKATHLMAAAPELLSAAELVLSAFNDFSPTGHIIDIPPLRKALTDAIKKARGES